MGEILEMVVPWVISTVLLFALLAWDESRLSPLEETRAWPVATRRIALVYFGILSLPVHFGRTRRSWLGVLQGLAWAAAIGVLDEGVGWGVESLVNRVVSP